MIMTILKLSVVVVGVVSRIHEEPACSQYHFQERVLEKLVRLEQEMTLQREKMASWEGEMSTEIAHLRDTESKMLKAAIKTPVIIFKAKSIADKTVSAGSLVRYTEIVTNVADGYDTSTGYFTAPQAGSYMFTTNTCVNGNDYVSMHIIAADVIIGTFYTSSYTSSYDTYTTRKVCTTGTGFGFLDSGNKVWVKYVSGSISVLYEDSALWNSFSGHLISSV